MQWNSTAANTERTATDFVKARWTAQKQQLRDTVTAVKKQLAKGCDRRVEKTIDRTKDTTTLQPAGGIDNKKGWRCRERIAE